MRKVLLGVVLLLALAVAAWAGGQTEAGTAATADGPAKIKYVYFPHPAEVSGVDTPWMQAVMEAANVNIDLVVIPSDVAEEKRNIILASGDIPDLMGISDYNVANTYGAEGVFAPVNDLLERYAPNVMKYIDYAKVYAYANPEDGLMYYIPRNYAVTDEIEYSVSYRTDIMDQLGLSEPTNMDEWYDVLAAVKRDTDLIPLSPRNRYLPDFVSFLSSFNLGKVYKDWGIVGTDFSSGVREIYYVPTTEEYKYELMYLNRLFEENLLDVEYLTHQYAEWWDNKVLAGKVFSSWMMNSWRAMTAEATAHANGRTDEKWITAKMPVNTGGRREYYKTFTNWIWMGVAVGADSKVKKEAVEFVDWFFTEEGMTYYWYGMEGVNYRRDGDKIVKLPEGDETTFNNVQRSQGWLFNTPVLTTLEIQLDLTEPHHRHHYIEANPKDEIGVFIPTLRATADQKDAIDQFYTDLTTYKDTMVDKFITGKESFDNWDQYVEQCNKLGADRGTAMVQEMMDAYVDQFE